MSALLDGTNYSFSTARRLLTHNGFALAVIRQDLVRLYLQMQQISCDTDVSTFTGNWPDFPDFTKPGV